MQRGFGRKARKSSKIDKITQEQLKYQYKLELKDQIW
jgi:hypothetical protein